MKILNNFNKIVFYSCLASSTILLPSYAQQVIKCTTSDGTVIYHNGKENTKGMNCSGTNLATVDKRATKVNLSVIGSGSNSNNGNSSNTGGEKINTFEQSIRNQKRLDLLKNELTQEKNQLEMTKNMKSNLKPTDIAQNTQLDEIIKTHQNNINTLEKELNIQSSNINPLNISSNNNTPTSSLTPSVIPGLGIQKTEKAQAKFEIEGMKVEEPPKNVPPNSENLKVNENKKAPSLPPIESMRQQLEQMKKNRDGTPEKDSSQHIEINRRDPKGIKISQATINYAPLPTPLSVPNLQIGNK